MGTLTYLLIYFIRREILGYSKIGSSTIVREDRITRVNLFDKGMQCLEYAW